MKRIVCLLLMLCLSAYAFCGCNADRAESEVIYDPVDVVRREGGLRRILFAGLFDPCDDRSKRTKPRHISRSALTGREIGAFGQVVKDRLCLFPLRHANLSLTHAIILDIRVQ